MNYTIKETSTAVKLSDTNGGAWSVGKTNNLFLTLDDRKHYVCFVKGVPPFTVGNVITEDVYVHLLPLGSTVLFMQDSGLASDDLEYDGRMAVGVEAGAALGQMPQFDANWTKHEVPI